MEVVKKIAQVKVKALTFVKYFDPIYKITKFALIGLIASSFIIKAITYVVKIEAYQVSQFVDRYSPYLIEIDNASFLWNVLDLQLKLENVKLYDKKNNLLISSNEAAISPKLLTSIISGDLKIKDINLIDAVFFNNDASIANDFFVPADNLNIFNSKYYGMNFVLHDINVFGETNNNKFEFSGSAMLSANQNFKGSSRFKFQGNTEIDNYVVDKASISLISENLDLTVLKNILPEHDLDAKPSVSAWLNLEQGVISKVRFKLSVPEVYNIKMNKVLSYDFNANLQLDYFKGDLSNLNLSYTNSKNSGEGLLQLERDNNNQGVNFTAKNINLTLLNSMLSTEFKLSKKLGFKAAGGTLEYSKGFISDDLYSSEFDAKISNAYYVSKRDKINLQGVNANLRFASGDLLGKFSANCFTIDAVKYFELPLQMSNLSFILGVNDIYKNERSLKISKANFKLSNTNVSLDAFLYKNSDNKLRYNLALDLDEVEVLDFVNYFPKTSNDNLTWLKHSLKDGQLSNVKLFYRNDLDSSMDLSLDFSNLDWDYAHAEDIRYPAIYDADGKINLSQDSLSFNVNNGMLASGNNFSLSGGIDNIAHPVVKFDANITGELGSMLDAVKKIEDFSDNQLVSTANLQGLGEIDLSLSLPLEPGQTDFSYTAKLSTKKANLFITDLGLKFNDINTNNISFNSDYQVKGKLDGLFCNNPIESKLQSVGNKNTPALKLEAKTKLSFEQFNLSKVIDGDILYTANALIPLKRTNSTNTNVKLTAEVINSTVSKDKNVLSNAVNPMVNFEYTNQGKDKHFYSISLPDVFIGSVYLDKHNIDTEIHLTEMDLEKYLALLSYGSKEDGEINTDNSALNKLGFLDIPGVAYILNNYNFNTDIHIENMSYGKLLLGYNAINFEYADNSYKFDFDGPAIKGVLVANLKENKLYTDFQHLDIDLSTLIGEESKDKIDFKISEINLPRLDFSADKISFGSKVFFDVNFNLIPSYKGYSIPHFKANMANANIASEIKLLNNDENFSIKTAGVVNSNNFGKTLNAFSNALSLVDSNGKLDFYLNWDDKFIPGVEDLDGKIEIKLHDGSIKGISQGVVRVLSLFNINNIGRRLKFDFRDLDKNTIVFNTLDVSLKLIEKEAVIKSMELNSNPLKITCTGKASLENYHLDLLMDVIPDVTSSLPVAATLATGNPVMAPISIMVDRIFGEKISELAQNRYKITGDMSSPVIEDVVIN